MSDGKTEPNATETDVNERPSAAEQRIAELEAELEQKRREAAESYDRYVREVAESENFKKRMQRDKADAIRYANEALVRDLLPVADNLEWALDHAGESADTSIFEGIKLTLRMLRDVLTKHGVSEAPSQPGDPFDPAIHEAMGMEPSAEWPANTVLRVQQKGYRLGDRLIRAARVVVSVGAPASEATH